MYPLAINDIIIILEIAYDNYQINDNNFECYLLHIRLVLSWKPTFGTWRKQQSVKCVLTGIFCVVILSKLINYIYLYNMIKYGSSGVTWSK